jgi:hypothetical protein
VKGVDVALVITSLATLVTAIGGVVIGIRNSSKIAEVHRSTNGKMEELVRVVKAASFAEGEKAEFDRERERHP